MPASCWGCQQALGSLENVISQLFFGNVEPILVESKPLVARKWQKWAAKKCRAVCEGIRGMATDIALKMSAKAADGCSPSAGQTLPTNRLGRKLEHGTWGPCRPAGWGGGQPAWSRRGRDHLHFHPRSLSLFSHHSGFCGHIGHSSCKLSAALLLLCLLLLLLPAAGERRGLSWHLCLSSPMMQSFIAPMKLITFWVDLVWFIMVGVRLQIIKIPAHYQPNWWSYCWLFIWPRSYHFSSIVICRKRQFFGTTWGRLGDLGHH